MYEIFKLKEIMCNISKETILKANNEVNISNKSGRGLSEEIVISVSFMGNDYSTAFSSSELSKKFGESLKMCM